MQVMSLTVPLPWLSVVACLPILVGNKVSPGGSVLLSLWDGHAVAPGAENGRLSS